MFQSKDAQFTALMAAMTAALGDQDWLESLQIGENGEALLILRADPDNLPASERRRKLAIEAALSVDGITDAKAVMTAERPNADSQGEVPAPGTKRVRRGARLSEKAIQDGQPEAPLKLEPIPFVKRIIAVASAKGGVGKSTVSVNMAAALSQMGYSVGLLDADIYGPSVPTMLGVEDADPQSLPDGRLEPITVHGIKSLSIGYLTEIDAPMIWRGPMVMSAIRQMLNDAAWGTEDDTLDLLIIDTPPGTGDAALTLAQRIPLDGAIIVTTPQHLALADVRRGIAMFTKTAVPVVGIVETMSWFEDPAGNRHALFGEGGGRAMAAQFGLPLLAELPILMDIREGGDIGLPAALTPGSTSAAFQALSEHVLNELDRLVLKPAPDILFED
ncbi:MAG: Mrp/NBP35 family ATP-binding protein [Pseudomonadota bacterium]